MQTIQKGLFNPVIKTTDETMVSVLGILLQDLEQLIMAIGEYIDRHNETPKPFIWTAKATDVLEKISRARAALHKG